MLEEEDVHFLFLSAERAAGLDLHFATHLVLLEPVRDAATLEQVVSRAHRLGATGPVQVETIVMLQDLPDDIAALPKAAGSGGVGVGVGGGGGMCKAGGESDKHLAICDSCYRSFPTLAQAQAHEALCPRNPANADRLLSVASRGGADLRLSSIYRSIKPPPPISSSSTAARGTAN